MPQEPLFDARAFARSLHLALAERVPLSQREAAVEAGVGMATFSRAINADPNISHENVLRLQRWIASCSTRRVAA